MVIVAVYLNRVDKVWNGLLHSVVKSIHYKKF